MNQKYMRLPLAALGAVWLVACGTPGPTQPVPGTQPAMETPASGSAETPSEVPPTAQAATSRAPDASLPPGDPAPFPSIDLLRMVDQANGWASDYDGKLYRTGDGGATWYLVSTPANVQINAYGSSFLDAGHAWLSTYNANGAPGLLRTSDGGATWVPLTDSGLADSGGPASFQFSTPDEGLATVAGVGAGNLYLQEFETHDGGASFKVVPLVGLTDEQGLPEGTLHLCSLCVDAFHYDPARAIIVQGDMGTMEPRGAVHLQTSTDLGQHWTEMSLPLPAGYEDALVSGLPLTFPAGQHGFLPVRLMKYNADNSTAYDVVAVYETADGGASWSLTPEVIPGVTDTQTLQFITDLDAIAMCGAELCVTHDGAQSWETMTPNVDLSSTDTHYVMGMTFATPETGWMITSESSVYQLYRTTDGGESWTLLNP